MGMRGLAVNAALMLAVAACSSADDPVTVPTSAAPSTTTSVPVGSGHLSSAVVTIEAETWQFEASCALPGEDEVLVWGSGEDPSTGLPSELLLEASAASPYVGITTGGRLLEAAVDGPLILTIDAGTIVGRDIQFVADADIDTGVGTPAGVGSVRVECSDYVSSPLNPS